MYKEDNSHQIENCCFSQGTRVASKIPFDNVITKALAEGLFMVEYPDSNVSQQIKALWQDVATVMDT